MTREITLHTAPNGGERGFNWLSAEESAEVTLTHAQAVALTGILGAALLAFLWAPMAMACLGVAVLTMTYVGAMAFRLLVLAKAADAAAAVADDEARRLRAAECPEYAILLPVYRAQADVVWLQVAAIEALDYPTDKLQVLYLLEERDTSTLATLRAANLPPHFTVVRCASFGPTTKPRVCNLGLQLLSGEHPEFGLRASKLVVVYDVEDQPNPLQLRKAVIAFRRLPASVVAIQARLQYRNAAENLLTRWLDGEYLAHFRGTLSGLAKLRLIVPLGGTSNHFKTSALVKLGGWDAFNVAEDQELAIRIARQGWRVAPLDDITWEWANPTLRNWWTQRPRWKKGGIQAYLTHTRRPRALLADLGARGFIGFHLIVGLPLLLLLVNPIFWALGLLYLVARPDFFHTLYPLPLLYLGSLSLAASVFLYMGATLTATALWGQPGGAKWQLLSIVNWFMLSGAAWLAVWELANRPHHWRLSRQSSPLKARGTALRRRTVPNRSAPALIRLRSRLW